MVAIFDGGSLVRTEESGDEGKIVDRRFDFPWSSSSVLCDELGLI